MKKWKASNRIHTATAVVTSQQAGISSAGSGCPHSAGQAAPGFWRRPSPHTCSKNAERHGTEGSWELAIPLMCFPAFLMGTQPGLGYIITGENNSQSDTGCYHEPPEVTGEALTQVNSLF